MTYLEESSQNISPINTEQVRTMTKIIAVTDHFKWQTRIRDLTRRAKHTKRPVAIYSGNYAKLYHGTICKFLVRLSSLFRRLTSLTFTTLAGKSLRLFRLCIVRT